ncbi:predicted protein [Uncinocarpus reesii 1704]|uniref:Uncharacterized protein n=1 Tax=Uncinocarpus reesii (strain UAMH 1704) TaxID=336963 RepID=C4JEY3_UNCRE|nr:uncharacterized protein UREG_00883 [Uncinocarpus reesii 1704]EEP76036.1 predicted protein [Uncinocarpus reesii 1704]
MAQRRGCLLVGEQFIWACWPPKITNCSLGQDRGRTATAWDKNIPELATEESLGGAQCCLPELLALLLGGEVKLVIAFLLLEIERDRHHDTNDLF